VSFQSSLELIHGNSRCLPYVFVRRGYTISFDRQQKLGNIAWDFIVNLFGNPGCKPSQKTIQKPTYNASWQNPEAGLNVKPSKG